MVTSAPVATEVRTRKVLLHLSQGIYVVTYTPITSFDLSAPQSLTALPTNCGCSTAICSFSIGSFLVPEGFFATARLQSGFVLGVYVKVVHVYWPLDLRSSSPFNLVLY
jgi:hypothetical protein